MILTLTILDLESAAQLKKLSRVSFEALAKAVERYP
jgi:hypothetical protein